MMIDTPLPPLTYMTNISCTERASPHVLKIAQALSLYKINNNNNNNSNYNNSNNNNNNNNVSFL